MDLMKASNQWASRPADERYTSLITMRDAAFAEYRQSREVVVSTGDLSFKGEDGVVKCYGANGFGYAPTNWAFGQMAQHAEAPAGYLRTLEAKLAADCLNYGFGTKREAKDAKLLLRKTSASDAEIRAMTGPNYGRIWDHEILTHLIGHYGDGTSGQFRVPGEWGKALKEVTKDNTTLYRGDRSMFLFLVDEENRIEMPNRRNGKSGSLARGFFLWQSEVSAEALGYATFLFDFVCGNRIVWGAQNYNELSMRHTVNAPDRWKQFLDEMVFALKDFAGESTDQVQATIQGAREAKLDDVEAFVTKHFGKRSVEKIALAHMSAESRPMETIWDVVVGATEFAHQIPFQDERIVMETKAGSLLDLVKVS